MMGGIPKGTLEAPGRAPSVLALHGFGATPEEVSMAVEIARELGLRALAPLLPGHGTSVEDLAQTGFDDWLGAAERAFAELSPAGPVIVVGSSMGSLLALSLAADHPAQVAGVAALAPATRLAWPFPSLALALVCGLRIPDFSLPKSSVDIRDAVLRKQQVTYEAQPAYAGNEVRLGGRRVEKRLGEIRCPAFIAHGRHDHVCPVNNAYRAYAQLGTPAWEKELLILPRSYHIITRDLERGVLRTALYDFVRRLLARVESGRAQVPVEPYPPAALPVSDRLVTTSS
jgi:carboxylesterase